MTQTIRSRPKPFPFRLHLSRCSRPLCSSQNTGGTPPPHGQSRDGGRSPEGPIGATSVVPARSLRTQQRAQDRSGETDSSERPKTLYWVRTPRPGQCQCSTHERHRRTYASEMATKPIAPVYRRRLRVLLRKEVIQPHLPVRLPCYDLVLITDPTFDSSFLAVRPLASGVTDFHDLTGGVYKARERIHRSVADLRLLATPTS
jgi:hypothetical protein